MWAANLYPKVFCSYIPSKLQCNFPIKRIFNFVIGFFWFVFFGWCFLVSVLNMVGYFLPGSRVFLSSPFPVVKLFPPRSLITHFLFLCFKVFSFLPSVPFFLHTLSVSPLPPRGGILVFSSIALPLCSFPTRLFQCSAAPCVPASSHCSWRIDMGVGVVGKGGVASTEKTGKRKGRGQFWRNLGTERPGRRLARDPPLDISKIRSTAAILCI